MSEGEGAPRVKSVAKQGKEVGDETFIKVHRGWWRMAEILTTP